MMTKLFAIGLVTAMSLLPATTRAEDAPQKSERAMSPDSAKSGQSPDPKSERAMSPDSANPGASPDGKSERAMDPDKSKEK